MTIALIIAVIWLAYANGANDNFKGVATLYGCGASSFERARLWATVATLAGSMVAVALAASLAMRFSGYGLVPPDHAGSSFLPVSVGAAAAATILIATVLGMPTSTTHALTGALLGVSFLINGGTVPPGQLWGGFLLPLLLSPVLAVVLAAGGYLLLRRTRIALGVTRETCVCLGATPATRPLALTVNESSVTMTGPSPSAPVSVSVGESDDCVERYAGRVVGIDAQSAVNTLHRVSAGAVCFARAVNDTPKIAALLLIGGSIAHWNLVLVAVAMAVGGLIQSRKVAETMSRRITPLNSGQGLTGNLVTSFLVIGASKLGLPVSTTHISVGAILGIGVVGGRPQWRTIAQIGASWMMTLPIAGVLGAVVYLVFTSTWFGAMA